jgi:hypothetical protein
MEQGSKIGSKVHFHKMEGLYGTLETKSTTVWMDTIVGTDEAQAPFE